MIFLGFLCDGEKHTNILEYVRMFFRKLPAVAKTALSCYNFGIIEIYGS